MSSEPTKSLESQPKYVLPEFKPPPEHEWFYRGLRGKFLVGFITGYCLFHLAYAVGALSTRFIFLTFDAFTVVSLTLTILLTFYVTAARTGAHKTGVPWWDVLLMILAVVGFGYLFLHLDQMYARTPVDSTAIVIGTVFILVILEGLRRTMGWMITGMMVLFFLYAMFSNYFPGILWSRGFSYETMIAHNFAYDSGMIGMISRLFAKLMVVFMIFATTIQVSGAGRALMKFSLGLLGHLTGGASKVAVVASGIFGSIGVAGPGNVFVTGSVTIPLMKSSGQTPEYAAAVEAVSSGQGALSPPIMGAISFIVAEWLNMPYYLVLFAAAIPTVLFVVGLFFMVDFQARRQGIPVIPKTQLPSAWEAIKEGWYYLIPIALFVYFLGYLKYRPEVSIVYAWVALMLLGQIRRQHRITPQSMLVAMKIAVRMITFMGPVMLSIGIVVASLALTGMPNRFTGLLIQLSGGSQIVLLLLTAIASIVMGMGMPSLAIYFVLATLCAPALIQSGVPPIIAHLFILYTAEIHYFTPPVMSAVIFTSTIAQSRIWPTSWWAMRLGLIFMITPFILVYNPSMALQGGYSIFEIAWPFVTSIIGCYLLAAGVQGWLVKKAGWAQRLFLLVAGGALIIMFINPIIGACGFGLALLVFLWQGITPMWLARKVKYAFANFRKGERQ